MQFRFFPFFLPAAFLFFVQVPLDAQTLSVSCNVSFPYIIYEVPFSETCTASGGVAPYSWSMAGPLPTGFSFSSSGNRATVSGTPQILGEPLNQTSITVTDSASQTLTRSLFPGLNVRSCASLINVIASDSLAYPNSPSGGAGVWSGIAMQAVLATGCPWTLGSDASWISFQSTTSGTFPLNPVGIYGTIINFTVEPNPDAVPRHGNLWISTSGGVLLNVPLTVNSSACTYSVSPASAHFGSSGGSGTLAVTPSPSDCVPVPSGPLFTSFDRGTWFYGIFPNAGSAVVQTVQFGSAPGLASGPNSTFTVNEDAGDSTLKVNCVQWATTRSAPYLQIGCGAAGGTPPYNWSTNGVAPSAFLSDVFYNPNIPTATTGFSYNTLSTVGPFNFTVQATDSSSTPQTASKTLAGTILPAPYLSCPAGTATMGPGPEQVGLPYTLTCQVGAGTPPYQWSISTGALPSGLFIGPDSSGNGATISGNALSPGPYSYTLQAIDGSSSIATHVFAGAVVTASAPPPLSISCNPLPIQDFEVGIAMPATSCTAAGGQPPYFFAITGQPLAPGLQLNQTNGTTAVLSGTPTAKGLSPFFVVVNDSSMPTAQAATVSFGGFFASQLVLSCSQNTGPMQLGQPYKNTCLYSGGSGPVGVALTGSLPAGLDYSAGINIINSAIVTGTPTTPGPYSYTITAVDALPASSSGPARVSQTFSGTISACTSTLNPVELAFPAQGGNGLVNITAASGCPWTVTNVPAGITLTSPNSGTGNGTITFTVSANNGGDLSESFAIGGQPFTVYQQGAAVPGLNFVGSMPHLAAEENWTTTFTLLNKSAASVTSRLSFSGDAIDPSGNGPLLLPLTFPQQAAAGPLLVCIV